jgi:VanZ family protein
MMRLARALLTALTAVYWAILFTLTHIPSPPRPPGNISDKTEHFIAYGILGALLYLTLWVRGVKRTALVVLTVCLAYGAIDEWLQAIPFVHRSCELRDWYADAIGTLVGIVIASAARLLLRYAHHGPPVATSPLED